MLKNFNKTLNQKPQNPVQQQPVANQKQAVVAASTKPVAAKGPSKHEQIELLALLEKCTQIMKDDRLNLRNLIKDGAGQEVEEILIKHKKKQDVSNLTLDLRKYLNKSKFKGGQTPSNASNASNLAPTPNQRSSQANLSQVGGDARQTRKGEQDFRQQQMVQQQKTFSDALNMQQNKNMVQLDENQQFAIEQQRQQQQHQLAMQMRQQQQHQQQQLLQQQQLEQQMKQQNQYPQKMSPFRRPQHQQIQEMNNSNSPLKQSDKKAVYSEDIKTGGAFGNFLEQQKSYSNASQARTEQKITEYTEEDEQNVLQLQQQSIQNQQVEVNENEESLRNRLQEVNEDENLQVDEDYNEQEDMEGQEEDEEEYQQEDHSQFRSQSQYSQAQMSGMKQQQYQSQQSQNAPVSESAMITQNSQDLTPEQQHQYLENLDNQGQQNYFQQQFSSRGRQSSFGQNEEQIYSQQQVEEAILQEQQRIQHQEEEMARVMREREQFIQQAIERSEQSRFGNSNVRQETEEDVPNQRATVRDEDDSEVQEEFFDQITDLKQNDPSLNKLGLIKLGSFQRGNSYQVADDPVTPMNHPVNMDNEVQRAPVKHRMEEIGEQEDEDPFNFQKRNLGSASNVKSQYSEVKCQDANGDQRYQLGGQESRRKNTQESGSKYNQSAYSANNQNSVRKSNNDIDITTEFIQHNFEVQMEKAYLEQQHQKSSQRGNLFNEEKSVSSAFGQQMSADKQQFNHMNLFNCAVSGFAQDQHYSSKDNQEYDSKVNYNLDNYVRSATNQFTQPNEEIDDSCSINFANEKVELKYNVEEMLESSVRDSNLQVPPQPSYVPKSEILRAFSNEQQPSLTTVSQTIPSINVNNSTTLNVVHKTYENYYPERIAIDISGNLNLFQKKTTPYAPVNIFSTPSQSKYLSVGISQEQNNSNQKVYSSSILPPSILRSPAFRREYLRGTADPSANRDRVTSVISPSRDHQRLDPSQDPIKRKYNHLFTSPQLMKQCNVDYEKENIGISHSPESQGKFINSERELIEQETKEFMKRSMERSAQRQIGNSNVFNNWDTNEVLSSRLRDSSVPKKSINFIRSPYTSNTLKDSVMNTPNMKQSIQLPMFLANANQCTNSEKNSIIACFQLYNRTAQEIFDAIFGNQTFQDKVTKLHFRSRMCSTFVSVPIPEIDNFFDFLDINQDQVLDVNEVGPVLMSMCDYKSKENGKLIKVFNFLDIDRKGFVTRYETEQLIHPSIIKKNYHNTALNLSKQMFKEVDTENKGYITYWELYSCKNKESVKQLIDILTS